MAGRVLGNNSLWSVEEAEAGLREIAEGMRVALVALGEVSERGKRLQDALIVGEVADARVALAGALVEVERALGRLGDAKEGRWRGRVVGSE